MRVLLVSNWLPPIPSGSSYYASSVARSLAARGHELRLVTMDWGDAHRDDTPWPFPVERIPVLKVPRLPIFYNLELMGFAFTPANVRRLRRLVAEFRPDVVHLVNHIFDTTFLVTKVAREAGVPVVGSITTPIQHENRRVQALMALADRATLGRFGVRHWDGIVSLDGVVHGAYVRGQYGEAAFARSVVIPFGVRFEARDLYDVSTVERSAVPQALFVGHIHPFRNPTALVRAMQIVRAEVPGARLVLAGRVDLDEPVRVARELGLGDDAVQFLGSTPHERVVELMHTSQVFASWATGPYPGLGTAPMEAMLCETPVVNDLPEDLFGEGKLRSGENILLVDSKDPASIARALVPVLRDPEVRARIGAAGRRFVLEHLSWEGIAAEIERLYERVVAERAGAR